MDEEDEDIDWEDSEEDQIVGGELWLWLWRAGSWEW